MRLSKAALRNWIGLVKYSLVLELYSSDISRLCHKRTRVNRSARSSPRSRSLNRKGQGVGATQPQGRDQSAECACSVIAPGGGSTRPGHTAIWMGAWQAGLVHSSDAQAGDAFEISELRSARLYLVDLALKFQLYNFRPDFNHVIRV